MMTMAMMHKERNSFHKNSSQTSVILFFVLHAENSPANQQPNNINKQKPFQMQ